MDRSIFDLAGRIAIVTGAARGLGKATALGLATYGADIAAIGRTVESCARTVAEIQAMGRRVTPYACDISDYQAVCRAVTQIHKDFGRVDILANIAGITARIPTVEIEPDIVRRLNDVNYYGTFWMCKEVGKIMLAQKSGSIINMSALGGGLVGLGRGNAAYSSTRGAVVALTRDLACEWGQSNVRVNAVAPCWFQTDMNATSIFANQRFMDQVYTKLPMKRIGKPEDLVGPIVFLASDASAMITGFTLPVDGGAAATCPIEWKPDPAGVKL